MGWAYGVNNDGREIGYSVNAICDAKGCKVKIDRGLAYVCGGMHDGGDFGCGKYFCSKHRTWAEISADRAVEFCKPCAKAVPKAVGKIERARREYKKTGGVPFK